MMDTERDFDMEKDGKSWALLPREAEWQEYVSKFQKVDPTSKALEKWKIMQNIQIS
jgi:L-rhamnose mutarotase